MTKRIHQYDLIYCICIFLFAFAPRFYVATAWVNEPVWDGHYYDFGARRIAEGFGYSDDLWIHGQKVWHPWCHYPVGYSAFLAFFYRIFGPSTLVASIANSLIGAAIAVVTHQFMLQTTNRTLARVSSAIIAFTPGMIVYSALLMTEPLSIFGVLLAGWIASCRHSLKHTIGAGFILGLTALVRPQSILAAPFLGLFNSGKTWRSVLLSVVLATLSALAVTAPWTYRNCRVMDRCAWISTNAGWNLAIGSFPRATGRFETLRSTDGCSSVTGQVQQDQCWRKKAIEWIREDPIRFLKLIPTKWSHTFDHESFPIGYLAESNPTRFTQERQLIGRSILTWSYRCLLLLAALGSARSIRHRKISLGAMALIAFFLLIALYVDSHPFWPIALLIPFLLMVSVITNRHPSLNKGARSHLDTSTSGFMPYLIASLISVIGTHALFFGEDRYHMVLVPIFGILASFLFTKKSLPT